MKFWLSFLLAAPALAAFPALSGVDLGTGKPVTVSMAASDPALVLVFLSAQCPCSQAHEATLKTLSAAHPNARFVGVHANSDENAAQSSAHFRDAKLPFPVLQDEHQALANRYGALKTPHVFVVNEAGEVLFRGGIDDSRHPERAKQHYLADALTAIEAGKKPEISEARALGCVIAR